MIAVLMVLAVSAAAVITLAVWLARRGYHASDASDAR
jgi:hypothetical protein